MTSEAEPLLLAPGQEPAPRVTFFFDRNLGHRVPEGLRARGWSAELHDDHFGETTPDTTLFRLVRERGWVYVTQDRKIRSRGPERQALLDNGLRTFSVASTANLPASVTIEVLAKAEVGILQALRDMEAPFVMAINKDSSLHALALA